MLGDINERELIYMIIRQVSADKWDGIYIDNDLIAEDHPINFSFVIKTIIEEINKRKENIEYESYWVDRKWITRWGNLPSNFNMIPKDVLGRGE